MNGMRDGRGQNDEGEMGEMSGKRHRREREAIGEGQGEERSGSRDMRPYLQILTTPI